jgi:hypothetical protein
MQTVRTVMETSRCLKSFWDSGLAVVARTSETFYGIRAPILEDNHQEEGASLGAWLSSLGARLCLVVSADSGWLFAGLK